MHDERCNLQGSTNTETKEGLCKILTNYILWQHTVYYLFHEPLYHLFMWKERNLEMCLRGT